jgi:hypothetical protein
MDGAETAHLNGCRMAAIPSAQMTVVVVRAWFEDRRFRARLIFDAAGDMVPTSVVVDSFEDMVRVLRERIETIRPRDD